MTSDELKTVLQQEVKDLASKLEDVDYDNAISNSQYDTGWTLPVATSFKIRWFKQRCIRHLLFFLATGSAVSYKVKQFAREQKFTNLMKIVDYMDKEYERTMESNLEEFAGVSSFHVFGTKIDAGFSYSRFGEDTTYDEEQKVIITPGNGD